MIDSALEPLVAALRDSEFLRTLRAVRRDAGAQWALAGARARPLREDEIRELSADGNTAENWRRIRVADGFRPGRVRHCDFLGYVTLGRFEGHVPGPGGVEVPTGVVRSTLSNCVVGHDALVHNVDLLAGYAVGERAVVAGCGRVVCDGPTVFGNGTALPIGPQCGGRWAKVFAEITLDLAALLTDQRCDPDRAARYSALLSDYMEQAKSERGIIGPGAVVCHVPVVRNTYIGPGAQLDAAARIESSTLLSTLEEPVHVGDGARVCEGLLQWGARVRGPAVVERAVLLEHAAVEGSGSITDSVLGPNSAVGGAEVTSSLVGPFVGAHHEGLLIAARWPAGRGNLGYGAAVGCNHTSRAPDQEAVLGEGLFVGLGATIQYPADLSRAPYSVLASGLNLPPQKIAFPFSLVRPLTGGEPTPGAAPGANVLVPAWVLAENLYSVQRCQLKFRARDRATRHRLDHEVFRPELLALVADALQRLERPAEVRDAYTDREIPGLGRNVLLERHRVAAIRCYTAHLQRVRALRLLERAVRALVTDRGPGLARVMESEGVEAWQELIRLPELLEAYGAAVERSRERDEERGLLVIDDYAAAHAPTREDPIVRYTWDEVRRAQDQVARVLVAATQEHPLPRRSLGTAPLVGGS
jgi:hypothetical protein